jgi:hypothetical protein
VNEPSPPELKPRHPTLLEEYFYGEELFEALLEAAEYTGHLVLPERFVLQ